MKRRLPASHPRTPARRASEGSSLQRFLHSCHPKAQPPAYLGPPTDHLPQGRHHPIQKPGPHYSIAQQNRSPSGCHRQESIPSPRRNHRYDEPLRRNSRLHPRHLTMPPAEPASLPAPHSCGHSFGHNQKPAEYRSNRVIAKPAIRYAQVESIPRGNPAHHPDEEYLVARRTAWQTPPFSGTSNRLAFHLVHTEGSHFDQASTTAPRPTRPLVCESPESDSPPRGAAKHFPPRQFRQTAQSKVSISSHHFAKNPHHTAQSISIFITCGHKTICRTREFRITIFSQKINCCGSAFDFPVYTGHTFTHREPK
jgi:hypothetical protein